MSGRQEGPPRPRPALPTLVLQLAEHLWQVLNMTMQWAPLLEADEETEDELFPQRSLQVVKSGSWRRQAVDAQETSRVRFYDASGANDADCGQNFYIEGGVSFLMLLTLEQLDVLSGGKAQLLADDEDELELYSQQAKLFRFRLQDTEWIPWEWAM